MTIDRDLKKAMKDVKRAARATAGKAGSRHNVNVSARSNVVVARNVGSDGSVEEVSAVQDIGPIRQSNPGPDDPPNSDRTGRKEDSY